MAKKKNLTDFGDVAKRNREAEEVKEEVVEEAVDTYSVNFVEVLDAMMKERAANPKVQRSFYLDKDVVKALDKAAKKQPKGFKSELINSFLRKTFGLDADVQEKDQP